MHRAGHLIRRSSVRLKSLSGGHSEIQMIIAQLREVRSSFKAFIAAQSTLCDDLVKWSMTLENEILQSTLSSFAELNNMWSEVQNDFLDSFRQLKCSFNLILEGERHVSQAKQIYAAREETEKNLKKELQKTYSKGTTQEIQLLRDKLNKNEKIKELAHMDVIEKTKENEAVRLIRVKESLTKISEASVQIASKACVIFTAQENVAKELPDVHDRAIQALKFSGFPKQNHVEEAKIKLRNFASCSSFGAIACEEPPPPYSPSRGKFDDLTADFSNSSLDDSKCNDSFLSSLSDHPTAPSNRCSSDSFTPSSGVYPCLTRTAEPRRRMLANSGPTEMNLTDSDTNHCPSGEANGLTLPDDPMNETNRLRPLRATRSKSSINRRKSTPDGFTWPSFSRANRSLNEVASDNRPETHSVSTSLENVSNGASEASSQAPQPPFNPFFT